MASDERRRVDTAPIVVYGWAQASVSLYFDGLPEDLRRRLLFLSPGSRRRDLAVLATAALVVIVRDFERCARGGVLTALGALGVPFAWFVDDDLTALAREAPGMAYYTHARVAAFARRACAIIVTSPSLGRSLGGLGTPVILWPCVFDASLAAPPSPEDGVFRIGAFGGEFRRSAFGACVLPAIEALANVRPVVVFATESLAAASTRVPVISAPFDLDFYRFVGTWRGFGLNVVVHPHGETSNIGAKSPASLLVTRYLGAAAVVGDEPAFADVPVDSGVLKMGRDPQSWLNALHSLAAPGKSGQAFDRLDQWARRVFDPQNARSPFATLAARGASRYDGASVSATLRWVARRRAARDEDG